MSERVLLSQGEVRPGMVQGQHWITLVRMPAFDFGQELRARLPHLFVTSISGSAAALSRGWQSADLDPEVTAEAMSRGQLGSRAGRAVVLSHPKAK